MIVPLLAAVAILLVLIFSENLWRKKVLPAEITRKIVHISVAVLVGFLPYFMSWRYIELLSIALLVVVLFSSKFKVFKSIHSVRRSTSGEVFFALATVILAFFFQIKWIFLAAMLHLGMADGLAAIVGIQFGMKHKYKVLGVLKTLYGSLTFLVVSFFILLLVAYIEYHIRFATLVWLPILATVVENLSVFGSDDISVPLIIAIGLRWF